MKRLIVGCLLTASLMSGCGSVHVNWDGVAKLAEVIAISAAPYAAPNVYVTRPIVVPIVPCDAIY